MQNSNANVNKKMNTNLQSLPELPVPTEKNNYTYILKCGDGSLYCGWTCDLTHRIAMHSSGKGGKYTRSHLPVHLVWYTTSPTREQAMHLEASIKKLRRTQKEKLIRCEVKLCELIAEYDF